MNATTLRQIAGFLAEVILMVLSAGLARTPRRRMAMKLNWLQKTALGALVNSLEFEAWLRGRALNIPTKSRKAIADRLKVGEGVIEAVEFELQNQALRALRELIGK